MQVLHIIPGLKIGGAETLLYNWLKYSKKENISYCVLCLSNPGYFSSKIHSLGIPLIHLNLDKDESSFSAPWKTLAEVIKIRPDVIHSHCTIGHYRIFPLLKIYFSIFSAKRKKIKLIHTIHGSFTFKQNKISLYEFILNKINVVQVAVGKKVMEHHCSLYNKNADIQVITNGIPVNESKRINQSQFNFKIVTVANLIPNIKGYETSIKAIHNLSLIFPDVTYHIFGEGSLRPYIQSFIEKNNLEKKIILHGHIHNVSDVLSEMDIYLLPSTTEGLPLSLLEAIASGLPIVSTKVGDIPNLLNHQESILIEPNQTNAMVDVLKKMILEESYRENCSAESIKLSKKIDIHPMIHKYEILYDKI